MLLNRRLLVGGLVSGLLVCACTGQESGEADESSKRGAGRPAETSPAVTAESLGGTARLEGVVRFVGTPPESPEIRVSGDSYCIDIHGDAFVDPDVVLDDDGHVQNVFVYLDVGVPEHRYAVPQQAVTVDQSGCMYVPRVLGVQVGQKVAFRNSDQTLHNVHSVVDRDTGNKPFNFGMPGNKGVVIERVFDAPEIMARIKCDVHPWMVAWVGVMSHPWYAVTDSAGRFTIEHVPDGEYVLEAWHETFGRQSLSLTVAAGVAAPLEIVFGGSGE